jgi:anti-sigma B factor antagonist
MPHTSEALLTIHEQRVARRSVLSVDGEVDITSAPDLQAAIEAAGTRAFEIWVDLSDTTFMDSSGLHALSEARSVLAGAGLRLVLVCPDGPVRRVLTLTGFDRLFEIHASRHAANHAIAM